MKTPPPGGVFICKAAKTMKRKNFRGISFWFLVAFTGLAHYWVAFSQLPPQLIKGDEGNYFAQTISEHPEIFQKLLLEFLPLLLPYCLFFWLVAFLSRPRGEATHWSDQPTVSLLLTWASCIVLPQFNLGLALTVSDDTQHGLLS